MAIWGVLYCMTFSWMKNSLSALMAVCLSLGARHFVCKKLCWFPWHSLLHGMAGITSLQCKFHLVNFLGLTGMFFLTRCSLGRVEDNANWKGKCGRIIVKILVHCFVAVAGWKTVTFNLIYFVKYRPFYYFKATLCIYLHFVWCGSPTI